MNQLSIERINEYAPYKVEVEDGQYIFETDHDILYGSCHILNVFPLLNVSLMSAKHFHSAALVFSYQSSKAALDCGFLV